MFDGAVKKLQWTLPILELQMTFYEIRSNDDRLICPWVLTFYDEFVAVECPECRTINHVLKDETVDGFKCFNCNKIIIYPGSWANRCSSYKVMDGRTKKSILGED